MQRLRYSINVMLDGCVDHRAGIPDEETHAYAARTIAQADVLLFGRVTYELMERAWRPPVSDDLPEWTRRFATSIDAARKVVVSRTLTSIDWNSELLVGDLADGVRALKALPGRGIYVGGVTLPTALAELGLIDEYEFIVHPRVVGHGPRLFEGLSAPLDLRPVGRTEFGSGAVATRYVPAR